MRCFLATGCFAICASIRTADISTDSDLGPKGDIQACASDMRVSVSAMTYTYLMSPMVEGKFYISNVANGRYLKLKKSGSSWSGNVKHSSHLVDKSKWMRDKVWNIKKTKEETYPNKMPVFTLKHRKTGKDLNSVIKAGAVWQFERAADGENWYIVQRDQREANSSKYYKRYVTWSNSEDADLLATESADTNSLWKIDYVPSMADRVNVQAWFKLLAMQKHSSYYNYNKFFNPEVSYKVQLKMGLSYPIWPGASVKWYDLCKGSDKQGGQKIDACTQFYYGEREFLGEIGKIEEDRDQVASKTHVRGVCDAQKGMFAYFLQQPKLLYYMSKDKYLNKLDSCYGLSEEELSLAAQKASVAECYQDCLDAIESKSEDSLLCYKMQQVNVSHLFEHIIDSSPQCAGLPFTVLEGLVDFKLKAKCWTYAPLNPLWLTNDMGMNFGNSACEADASFWRRTAREGSESTCPSGTACSCPGPSSYPKMTADIRGEESSVFITDGSAGAVSVTKMLGSTYAKALIKKMVTKGIQGGKGKGFSYLAHAALVAPLTIYKLSSIVLPEVIRAASWRCDLTVGCWPSNPIRTQGKCRSKDSVQKGNTGTTWMMPPPGLKFKKTLLGCALTSCSAQEKSMQKIGFSSEDNGEVYNCQPLSFEEMAPQQRYLYLSTLFYTDVASEYELNQALQKARQAASTVESAY